MRGAMNKCLLDFLEVSKRRVASDTICDCVTCARLKRQLAEASPGDLKALMPYAARDYLEYLEEFNEGAI
jgi:hypothetical protein